MAFLCVMDGKKYRFFSAEGRNSFFYEKLTEAISSLKLEEETPPETLKRLLRLGVAKREEESLYFLAAEDSSYFAGLKHFSFVIGEDESIVDPPNRRIYLWGFQNYKEGFRFSKSKNVLLYEDIPMETLEVDKLLEYMERNGSWEDDNLWIPHLTDKKIALKGIRKFCLDNKIHISVYEINSKL